MAVPQRCAHCGSTHVQAGFDAWQCLACGNRTDMFDGKALPKEPEFEGENPHNRRPM